MGSRKPPIVETSVIARKISGDSNSKIARDLRIDRSTVTRILESSEFPRAVEYGQIRVHRIIPDTCDALHRAVRKDNVPAILAVLNGTGILKQQGESKPVNVNVLVQIQAASVKVADEIAAFQDKESIDAKTKTVDS